ncbi:MAG: hypothetical protein IPP95_15195 [Flavobacteriales bacterium]|nr:MAG: hypothetical protein IPP95_15195 [Flavobacteriales bacterium]
MLLGIGLLIGGASGSSQEQGREPRSPAQEWQDVVYLKNGSVIRGMVIEQVPNVSLKIGTADGSVFVYAMDQVEKMHQGTTLIHRPMRSIFQRLFTILVLLVLHSSAHAQATVDVVYLKNGSGHPGHDHRAGAQ